MNRFSLFSPLFLSDHYFKIKKFRYLDFFRDQDQGTCCRWILRRLSVGNSTKSLLGVLSILPLYLLTLQGRSPQV